VDAETWDERYAASSRVWSAGPNVFVERELADLPPGRALDLGCGEGRHAAWLARRGWDVVAVDFSAVAVARGRELEPAVTWQVGDVLDADSWALLPDDLDLVVVAYLQLAAEERRFALRRAWASLRPGGLLLVVAHDTTNLTEGTGGPQDEAVLYTADDVLRDLGESAEVVRSGREPREVPAADGHGPAGTAWDALLVARRPG
jgi:SAM-dependent methyltransferase